MGRVSDVVDTCGDGLAALDEDGEEMFRLPANLCPQDDGIARHGLFEAVAAIRARAYRQGRVAGRDELASELRGLLGAATKEGR